MKLMIGIADRGHGHLTRAICTLDGKPVELTEETIGKIVRRYNSFEEGNRDNCQLCYGANGGVPGNENVVHGLVICDYCTVKLDPVLRAERDKGRV